MVDSWLKHLRVSTFFDIPTPPLRGALYYLDNGQMWLADNEGLTQYGDRGGNFVPDYALIEHGKIATPDEGGSWTVDRDGFVLCKGMVVTINGVQVLSPANLCHHLYSVAKGDVININGPSADCAYIPPKAVSGQQFPVGYIMMSTIDLNPADWLGYGAWERFARGRMLVGVNESDADFNASEKTGGEKSVTLTVAQMPAHAHRLKSSNSASGSAGGSQPYDGGGYSAASQYMENTGGGQAHNNMPPYVTVYMFRRAA